MHIDPLQSQTQEGAALGDRGGHSPGGSPYRRRSSQQQRLLPMFLKAFAGPSSSSSSGDSPAEGSDKEAIPDTAAMGGHKMMEALEAGKAPLEMDHARAEKERCVYSKCICTYVCPCT